MIAAPVRTRQDLAKSGVRLEMGQTAGPKKAPGFEKGLAVRRGANPVLTPSLVSRYGRIHRPPPRGYQSPKYDNTVLESNYA